MCLWFASVLVRAAMFAYAPLSNDGDLDKKSMDFTCYIDIKSEGLRDILRTILRDIQIINLNEDKPTV